LAAYLSRAIGVHGRSLLQPHFAAAGSSASPALDTAAHNFVVAAAAASAGVELQEGDVSELLLVTLLRLQQELVLGAARALRLHGSSSLNKPPPFCYLTTVMHTMIWFAVTQRLRYFAALAINHFIVSMPCNTPSS
jgi:hypothetical protein